MEEWYRNYFEMYGDIKINDILKKDFLKTWYKKHAMEIVDEVDWERALEYASSPACLIPAFLITRRSPEEKKEMWRRVAEEIETNPRGNRLYFFVKIADLGMTARELSRLLIYSVGRRIKERDNIVSAMAFELYTLISDDALTYTFLSYHEAKGTISPEERKREEQIRSIFNTEPRLLHSYTERVDELMNLAKDYNINLETPGYVSHREEMWERRS